jgi:FtsH-binding integral membrane protein
VTAGVAIFVAIPIGSLIYAIVGLVIFAGLTAFDFQRLRRTKGHPDGAAPRRVDLPRHPQRVSLLLSLFGREE